MADRPEIVPRDDGKFEVRVRGYVVAVCRHDQLNAVVDREMSKRYSRDRSRDDEALKRLF